MLNDLLFRLRCLFRRERVEAEMNEELRYHFDRQVEKYVAFRGKMHNVVLDW